MALGSCTSHQSFLWHWRPEVKRDLERRYGPASGDWWFGTGVKVARPERRGRGGERGTGGRFRGISAPFGRERCSRGGTATAIQPRRHPSARPRRGTDGVPLGVSVS